MTYNFDPDKWFDNERAHLELQVKSGKMTETEFRVELKKLEERLEEMWRRLDGSYILPE